MFTKHVAIILHCAEYIDYISPRYIVWKYASQCCRTHAVDVICNIYSQLNGGPRWHSA